MANLQERRDKDGKLISYSIRIYRGRSQDGKQLKPFTATFEVKPTWSEKSARKKAEAYAATLEDQFKKGLINDTRQTFASYCDYVIALKEQRGAKHSTVYRYKALAVRIDEKIGHIKLTPPPPPHLTDLYTALAQTGQNQRTGQGLSAKTIVEHHRLISTVLEQAVKEGLIPYNVARRATLPKMVHRDVNYFQLEDVERIREALKLEPIKWRTITHLFLITGARRGEILGLKWDKVNVQQNTLTICSTILYSPDIGVYESVPKTEKSRRVIAVPPETIQLLQEYRQWQNEQKALLKTYYQDRGYLFAQEDGSPMHPDSVTDWLGKFSQRHNLPHINPHAFRHTMASMLYYSGVDSVSISQRLGHAQVSTTANIYAHVMEHADQKNADILANVFFHKGQKNQD